jgi:hypothetical protein
MTIAALVRIGCLADLGFYTAWVVRTLAVPLLAAAGLVLWWWLRDRRRGHARAAAAQLRGTRFVLVFRGPGPPTAVEHPQHFPQ